jgi:hypothetical protein
LKLVRSDPLEVVRAPEVRTLWNRAIRPVARGLGFKPGNVYIPGWVRESAEERSTFWFQIDKYGFDKYMGGRFIVEFIFNDLDRKVSTRDRMWTLLDDVSRRAAFRMNNGVIASLPAPSIEIVMSIPEPLRASYLGFFKTLTEMPERDSDVWFRYATRKDAASWGDFMAARLPSVVAEGGRLLSGLPPSTSVMGGVILKQPKVDD